MERSDPQHIAVIHADLRQPEAILRHPDALRVLDFEKPVGKICSSRCCLFVAASEEPERLVSRLTAEFPAGSHLVISHGTADFNNAGAMEATDNYHSTSSYNPRTRASIEALFTGMPLITRASYRSRSGRRQCSRHAEQFGMYAGIARKEASRRSA